MSRGWSGAAWSRASDCASDGRGAVLTLTEAGWQAIRDAAPGHVESVRTHFLDLLTAEQVQALAGITETVLAHLRSLQDAPASGHQGRPSQGPDTRIRTRTRPRQAGTGESGETDLAVAGQWSTCQARRGTYARDPCNC